MTPAELEEAIETQVDRRNAAARSAESWTLSGDVDMAYRAKARAKMHHRRAEQLLAELRAQTAAKA